MERSGSHRLLQRIQPRKREQILERQASYHDFKVCRGSGHSESFSCCHDEPLHRRRDGAGQEFPLNSFRNSPKSPIEVKAESNQPSAPIVDSKPKEWPPEGFEEMEPLERLQRLLNRDGIPFDKLEEWIDCRCCMISRSKEWLIAACLEKFPKFKDTFTAWLTIPTPDFAAG